jgi:hypothetical protein
MNKHSNTGERNHVARTGRPQLTQSSSTVPSLFTLPFGVPATVGVPASLGGELGLEPGSVLCDALAVPVALGGASVCTGCHWRARAAGPAHHSVSSESSHDKTRVMKHQPYLVCNCAHSVSNEPNCEQPIGKYALCVADVTLPPAPRHLLVRFQCNVDHDIVQQCVEQPQRLVHIEFRSFLKYRRECALVSREHHRVRLWP